ncbi:PLC-like phosphodiesterase [Dissoconium aciculare CBS 342.82]|uniref:PLC-like phosphodiesterase n=1 Tax=Dissoconium aciculare CBS 342.82 TaxID=1314786 RepID=A0A6J3LSU4_9PEZI|nr:PLC-like phosphodiesterase [Dissoconium aciculare CBS 342.82]KAF1818846.1 PLC-like phosphodiesterase [Dissoconium aciculare CBS 342.82]
MPESSITPCANRERSAKVEYSDLERSMPLGRISKLFNELKVKARKTEAESNTPPKSTAAGTSAPSAPNFVMGAALSPGAVRLTVPSSNGVLRPVNGEWYFDDIDAQAADTGDRRFHQWLIARPPGAPADVFVLCNLQTGTYAGVWRDEWGTGSHRVKCSPGHLQAANIQFRVESANDPNDDKLVRFVWRGDESKVLMRKPDKDSIAVRQVGDEDAGAKTFRCEDIQYDYETFPDWMSRLPDDIALHHVNLPSTHQTLALHGIGRVRPDLGWTGNNDDVTRPWGPLPVFIDNPRCQDVSLWEQLQMGVRSLDIRLDLNKLPVLRREDDGSTHEEGRYFLYARHGLAEMGHSWSAVLLILQSFLRANTGETVIVNARYEKATPGSRDRWTDWLAAFVDETRPFWEDHPDQPATVYKWWEDGSKVMNDLQLHEVRGKIILTTDGDYMPADEADGRNRGMRFFPRDMVAVGKYDSKRDEWPQQLSSDQSKRLGTT